MQDQNQGPPRRPLRQNVTVPYLTIPEFVRLGSHFVSYIELENDESRQLSVMLLRVPQRSDPCYDSLDLQADNGSGSFFFYYMLRARDCDLAHESLEGQTLDARERLFNLPSSKRKWTISEAPEGMDPKHASGFQLRQGSDTPVIAKLKIDTHVARGRKRTSGYVVCSFSAASTAMMRGQFRMRYGRYLNG